MRIVYSLQQLLIKPVTRKVAGRSRAIDSVLLFVASLKANSYMLKKVNLIK